MADGPLGKLGRWVEQTRDDRRFRLRYVRQTNDPLRQAAERHLLKIVCLDVDHGDATLIILPSGRVALIDSAKDAWARRRVIPFLKNHEIGELAFTFNKMAGEIEDQIRRLKEAAEENKELFLGTIRALAQAIDAKDPYTRGHSVRVNRYSVVLARVLGMNEDQIADIHVASLMHDVGKIGINDKILQKPGKLTTEEFDVMKTHTTKGAQIMQPIGKMQRIIPGLRSHHERWEGGGYPDNLSADQIPLMARVIAVADAFDAMTTHRPYQKAMSFAQAQERLNVLKGAAFDERIVEAFNRAYQQGLIAPEAGNNLQVAGQDATSISSPSAIVAEATESVS